MSRCSQPAEPRRVSHDDGRTPTPPTPTPDDDIAQRYWDGLASQARRRARSPLFRVIKQLIGRADVPLLLDLVRRLAAGTYSDASPTDRELVSRALSAGTIGGLPASALAWFSEFVSPVAVSEALNRADDETLLFARSEFLHIANAFGPVAGMVPGLGVALALEIRRDPEWPPPMLFLLWLRHRGDPQVRQAVGALIKLAAIPNPTTTAAHVSNT